MGCAKGTGIAAGSQWIIGFAILSSQGTVIGKLKLKFRMGGRNGVYGQ
jgi:hypothetical protein